MGYALVTGSSRGAGKTTAIQLAKDGYDVFICYKKEKGKAEEVVNEIKKLGRKAFIIQADLVNDADRKQMVDEVLKITNHLDILVNNAGFDYGYMIEDYKLSEIEYMININLIQKMMVTKYFLPLLKKSDNARIVNIASRMGKEKTIETIGAYGPAEAGVIKFTQCCALEFRKFKIRVNCVAPGLMRTDLTESILSDEDFKSAAKANPSGRVGKPQDVANVISFLVSEKGSYINGETIGVNGGSNLG